MRPLVFFQAGFQRITPDSGESVGDVRSVVLATTDMNAACR
jgi:hypothetical protein